MNETQKTLIGQVSEQVFLKKNTVFLVNDRTVRFHVGHGKKIDVAYDPAHDLYDVTVHKVDRKTLEVTSETSALVFTEDLAKFFPARLVKDANVRRFLAAARGC